MLRHTRLNDRQAVAFERMLGIGAIMALSSAVASIFGIMCDPRIVVPGAPPFGSNAIYGMPVRWVAIGIIAVVMLAISTRFPRFPALLMRYRFGVYIGCYATAAILAMLPYPHHVLGSCLS